MTIQESKEVSLELVTLLEDKKAHDVVAIDVSSLTPLMDVFIIATADSFVQLKALEDQLDEYLAEQHAIRKVNPKETNHESPWRLLDYGLIVVHLFMGEAREFYNLEKLWHEGKQFYGTSEMIGDVSGSR